MAQLIKLQDYVSRYEQELTKYSNQFVRLKQQRWQEKKEDNGINDNTERTCIQRVKADFLDNMFLNQLRWASATPTEKSQLSPQYETDRLLRQLLQDLPDTYLLMYDPVFQIEQAPIELEAVLITPLEVYCLAFLKGEKDDIYQANSERFWNVWRGEQRIKVINPKISVQRTYHIVSRIVKNLMPIKQMIIAHNGYVDHFHDWQIECIDKRHLHQWLHQHKINPTPMKSLQIKAARTLLHNTRTVYYERIDDSTISWEINKSD